MQLEWHRRAHDFIFFPYVLSPYAEAKGYAHVCVRASVCACKRVCVCACVRASVCACKRASVQVCKRELRRDCASSLATLLRFLKEILPGEWF